MNSIEELTRLQYANQGVQSLSVVYDTLFIRLKIQDGARYDDILAIEKFSYDFDQDSFIRDKNSILINFGDTEKSIPFYSGGTSFLKDVLLKSSKTVLLVGIKKMGQGNIIPIIYQYDINAHTNKVVFPMEHDITEFGSIPPVYIFDDEILPTVSYDETEGLTIVFQSVHDTEATGYIHQIHFNVAGDGVQMDSYVIHEFDQDLGVEVMGSSSGNIIYKRDVYHGVLADK